MEVVAYTDEIPRDLASSRNHATGPRASFLLGLRTAEAESCCGDFLHARVADEGGTKNIPTCPHAYGHLCPQEWARRSGTQSPNSLHTVDRPEGSQFLGQRLPGHFCAAAPRQGLWWARFGQAGVLYVSDLLWPSEHVGLCNMFFSGAFFFLGVWRKVGHEHAGEAYPCVYLLDVMGRPSQVLFPHGTLSCFRWACDMCSALRRPDPLSWVTTVPATERKSVSGGW